jgi:hypothetical protein
VPYSSTDDRVGFYPCHQSRLATQPSVEAVGECVLILAVTLAEAGGEPDAAAQDLTVVMARTAAWDLLEAVATEGPNVGRRVASDQRMRIKPPNDEGRRIEAGPGLWGQKRIDDNGLGLSVGESASESRREESGHLWRETNRFCELNWQGSVSSHNLTLLLAARHVGPYGARTKETGIWVAEFGRWRVWRSTWESTGLLRPNLTIR